MSPLALTLSAAIVVLWVWAWWRIFTRAGYPGAFAFVMLVPVVNFVALLMLAFDPEWPVERELRERRGEYGPRGLRRFLREPPPGDDWI